MTDQSVITSQKHLIERLEAANDHAGDLIEDLTNLCIRFVELSEAIMKEIEKGLKS